MKRNINNGYQVEAVTYSGNKGKLHFQKSYKTLAQAEKVYNDCLDKYSCYVSLTDETGLISNGLFTVGCKLLKYRQPINK